MPGIKNEIRNYYSITRGAIRKKANEGEEGAVYSTWEVAGEKKGGWSHEYPVWIGTIQAVKITENKYGIQLVLELDDAIITVGTATRYFAPIAEALPNIDFSKKVTLSPYYYVKNGKRKVGVGVYQDDQKIQSAYVEYKETEDGKTTVIYKNGFPEAGEAPAKGTVKAYKFWNKYFGEVEEFLIEKVEEANKSLTNQYTPSKAEMKEVFDNPKPAVTNMSDEEYGDISISEIPF